MKSLIFITEALWVGGIETALLNLLKALDPGKYRITVLLLRRQLALADRLPEGCRLVAADRGDWPFAWLSRLTEEPAAPSRLHRAFLWLVPGLRWAEDRLFARHIRRLPGMAGFDTAVIYSDKAAAVGIRAVKAESFLLFYHHGAMRRVSGDGAAWRKAERIIALSEGQARDLRKFRPRQARKIRVLHNLADPEGVRRRAAAFDPMFSDGAFHIVTCGRLHRDKGVDLAAEACALLMEWGYDRIRWHILGTGPEEENLRRKIRGSGLENHLILHGLVENPCPYVARADLYVQPSRTEGYPMSILEAQILGRPVIATATPGAAELLAQEDLCGISAEAVARAVADFIRAPRPAPERDWERENRAILAQLEMLL